MRAIGADTTRLAGTAVLRSGDGGAWSTPIRFERERAWLLRDSAAWAVVQDSLRDAARRQSGGMLMMPSSELAEQLGAGDATAVDSLLAEWREADDPDERAEIERMLLR